MDLQNFNDSLCTNVTTQTEGCGDDITSVRLIDICVYSLFFVIGGPANTRVLLILLRNNLYNKSRHHTLLLNLVVADTIVCLLMLPTEVGWRLTSEWKAGDIGCRSFQFIRVFGLYASSMVLIVISIDRYYAVIQPFSYTLIGSKINKMLVLAWLVSILLSVPQTFVFHLAEHPDHKNFFQCVNFGFFEYVWQEKLYTTISIFFLYGLPLIAIIVCYTIVSVRSIYQQKKAAAIKNKYRADISSEGRGVSTEMTSLKVHAPLASPAKSEAEVIAGSANLVAARKRQKNQRDNRTRLLKQTFVIVATFMVCWTPYAVSCAWYYIDLESYMKMDRSGALSILYLFAVSNSIINPFIYGKFVKDNPQRV